MALFRIFKGNASKLGQAPTAEEVAQGKHDTRYAHEGFAYFTPEDGKFYIDTAGGTSDDTLAVVGTNRIPLNAAHADSATNDSSGNQITTTYAPLDSPAFTGIPTAPTASAGTSTTQLATTAFVNGAMNIVVIDMTATYSDITNILNSGKVPILCSDANSNQYAYLRRSWNNGYYFVASKDMITQNQNSIYVDSNDQWHSYGESFELSTNKVTSLSSSSTDSQYPSAKWVYDNTVMHTPSTAVGSTTQPIYVASDGQATAITGAIGNDTTGNAATATNATNDANGDQIDTTYLKLAGGTMTGALTLSGDPTSALHAATKQYVDNSFAANDAMVFKGALNYANPDTAHNIFQDVPSSGYSAGDTYRVVYAHTYAYNDAQSQAAEYCEVGDIIIAVKDFNTTASADDWIVVEHNIDGAVYVGATNRGTAVGSSVRPVYVKANGEVEAISQELGATVCAASAANRIAHYSTTTEISAAGHYVDSDTIGVNYTGSTKPSYNLYVDGTADIKIGSSDTTNQKKFVVQGNNRFLSIGGAGIQAYTGALNNSSVGSLYLNLNGGDVYIGGNAATGQPEPRVRLYNSLYRAATADDETPMIWLYSPDKDNYIWQVGSSSSNPQYYGYGLKYIGSGQNAANYLRLIADNQDGTDVTAIGIDQSGRVGIGRDANTNYRLIVNNNIGIQSITTTDDSGAHIRLIGNGTNDYSLGLALNNGGSRGIYQWTAPTDAGGAGWLLTWAANKKVAKFNLGGIKTGNILIGVDSDDANSNANTILNASSALYIKTTTNSSILFYTNNTARMRVSYQGHFYPEVNGASDLGILNNQWDNGYFKTSVQIGATETNSYGLYVNGTVGITKAVTLLGTDSTTAVLNFSRDGFNYITWPSTGTLALCPNATRTSANCAAVISSSEIYPGTTATIDLGTSSKYWKQIYTNDLTFISGGATRTISFTGTKATYSMIRFLDNATDTYGNGISIGGGGITVIGAGESGARFTNSTYNTLWGDSFTSSSESLFLLADAAIYIQAGAQDFSHSNGTTAKGKGIYISTAGHIYPYTANAANDGAQDLGSTTARWRNGYFKTSISIGASTATTNASINLMSDTGNFYIGNEGSSDDSPFRGIWVSKTGTTASGLGWNANNEISTMSPWATNLVVRAPQVRWQTLTRYLDALIYKNNTPVGEVWYDTGEATNVSKGQFFWRQYSPKATADTGTTGKYETYSLPAVTSGLSDSHAYDILTTKATPASAHTTVSQSNTTTSSWRKVLLSYQSGTDGAAVTSNTNVVYATAVLQYQPSTGTLKSTKIYGAVWNDYAEYRKTEEQIEPGRCIVEKGDDSLTLSTKRLERGCEIVSDTYGFAIGETDDCKTPIASSGRVLAYPYESREEFAKHIGWPVCSGPNGTVSIMTEEEEEKYPSRIIGTISAVPEYEEWGTGNVKVNGRIWIRIR